MTVFHLREWEAESQQEMDWGLRGTSWINHELSVQISQCELQESSTFPVSFQIQQDKLVLFRLFAFFTSETCVDFKMGNNTCALARLSSCGPTLFGVRRLLCGLQRGLLILLAIPEEKVVYLTSLATEVGLLSCELLYILFIVSATFQASICSIPPPLPCYSCTHCLRAALPLKLLCIFLFHPKYYL